VEFVTLGAPIPRGWLQRCIIDSHAAWREHLPRSVDPAHLTGRLVPDTAGSFSDIGFGTGVVLVELEEAHKNLGFVGELVETRATLLTMEERVRALEQDRADAEQRFDTKLAKALAMERDAQKRITDALRGEIVDLRGEIVDLPRLQEESRRIQPLQDEMRALQDKMRALQDFTKRGLELSNKVKKRVALAIARAQVERSVGRVKGGTESWSDFIHSFSPGDWLAVDVTRQLVKDLLADGAYAFNESIHNIPPEEVVGSIASMRQGTLRNAWEDVFFLAFKKRVSDEVFADELGYAAQQQQMLGVA
jgi:flagellar motility protein MotE (MotC chaperone)